MLANACAWYDDAGVEGSQYAKLSESTCKAEAVTSSCACDINPGHAESYAKL